MKSDTYYGKKASGYDEKRRRQARWRLEHEAVERMLTAAQPRHVLDLPCGTGRFVELYHALPSVRTVMLVDKSAEMVNIAEKKGRKYLDVMTFRTGDATEIPSDSGAAFDTVVCCRFLDLIDEVTLRAVMTEITRVTEKGADKHPRNVILTIRLGDLYVAKSNTATHDRKKWWALVKRLGWRVEETVPIFNAGWVVLRLGRVK